MSNLPFPLYPLPSMGATHISGRYSYATALRCELSIRNRDYARRFGLDCRESHGGTPVVCYMGSEENAEHGNFLPASYRAILKNDRWRKRLAKPHTSAHQALPREGFPWRELDSCNSSDALLMNIFCYPGMLKTNTVCDLLGLEPGVGPEFGFRARVPLSHNRFDRTEVDMRVGDLLVEAKLTEADFQSKAAVNVEAYRDFDEVFEAARLPRREDSYLSYQLIRNVLAAYANHCSFCVMLDARRPDLLEAWYAVMSCVRPHEVRMRCKVLTWQELAESLPKRVQQFLVAKYGIIAPHNSGEDWSTLIPEEIA
jgi:hypothetical protein